GPDGGARQPAVADGAHGRAGDLAGVAVHPAASVQPPGRAHPGNAQSVYREGERMMVCLLVALVVIHLGAAMQVMGAGAGLPLVGAGVAACFLVTPIALVRISRAADRSADASDAEGGTRLRS